MAENSKHESQRLEGIFVTRDEEVITKHIDLATVNVKNVLASRVSSTYFPLLEISSDLLEEVVCAALLSLYDKERNDGLRHESKKLLLYRPHLSPFLDIT